MLAIRGTSVFAHFANSGRLTSVLCGSLGEVLVSVLAGDQTTPRMTKGACAESEPSKCLVCTSNCVPIIEALLGPGLNVTIQLTAAPTVTVPAEHPRSPLSPSNVEGLSDVTWSVTAVPTANGAEQSA